MKSAIKRNILLIISMIIFISLSGVTLGKENIMLSIVIVFISFMLLGKDLSGNIALNGAKLIGVVLVIGIFTYLTNFDIYIGLLCNIIGIFIIAYLSAVGKRGISYRPFLLAYILILNISLVSKIEKSIVGILGVLFCTLFAMLLRYYIGEGKVKNIANRAVEEIVIIIGEEIEAIKRGNKIDKYRDKIEDRINNWNEALLNKRDSYFEFTKSEDIQINLMSTIRDLQEALEAIKNKELIGDYIGFLDDAEIFFIKMSKVLKRESNMDELLQVFKGFYSKYRLEIENDYLIFNSTNIIERFFNYIRANFSIYEGEGYKKEILEIDKPDRAFMVRSSLSRDSISFAFAVRASIIISFTYFLVRKFNLVYGEWLILIIAIGIIPYIDYKRNNIFNRVTGILIGTAVYFLIFSFVNNIGFRALVVLVAYYIFDSLEEDYLKIAAITVVLLGIFGMADYSGLGLIYYRIIYTVLGLVIAVIGSLLILPYNIRNKTIILIKYYNKIVNEAIKRFNKKDAVEVNKIYTKNILNLSRALENKIQENNRILKDKNIEEFLHDQRKIINNLYILIHEIENPKYNYEIKSLESKDYLRNIYDMAEKDNYLAIRDYLKEEALKIQSPRMKAKYFSICKLYIEEIKLEKEVQSHFKLVD